MSASPRRTGTFGRDVLISFGFTGLTMFCALANSVVVARMVGTEGRGLYALAVSVTAMAWPIAGGGLNHAATWQIGRGADPHRIATLNHLWSLGVAVVGGAVALTVLGRCGGLPDGDLLLVVLAASAIVPAMVYCELTRGLLLGGKRVLAFNGVGVAAILTLLAANLVLLRHGTRQVLVALTIAYWLPAVVIGLLYLLRLGRARLPDRALLGSSLSYGSRALGVVVAEATLLRADLLLMAIWVPIADIGIYSTADQATHMVALLGIVAGRMMLAESANDPTGRSSGRKLGLAARLLMTCTAAVGVAAAATAWFLIPAVFGPDFAPAYLGVLILMPAALAKGLYALFSTWLLGRAVLRPVIVAGVVAIVFDLVAVALLAGPLGWRGVALAKTLAYLIQAAITIRGYRATEGAEPLRWVLNADDLAALRTWLASRLAR
jgi:O-antigen/teichoic acid export membrane protein